MDVDVINEHNQVLGQEDLATVHEHGLLHRSAVILIFRDNAFVEVLTVRRGQGAYRGLWSFVGGHVWAGESTAQAAHRRLRSVFSGPPPKGFVMEDHFHIVQAHANDNEFVQVFRAVWPGPFTPDPAEVLEYRFMGLDQLRIAMLSHPGLYAPMAQSTLEAYIADRQP